MTGSRVHSANLVNSAPIAVMAAQQEALGDLKLYRIPEPVTVAANAQKQIALLHQPQVDVRLVYRSRLNAGQLSSPAPAERLLITRNRNTEGLGLPLPGGRVASGGDDKTVKVWDPATGQVNSFAADSPVTSLATSSNHTALAVGGKDGSIVMLTVEPQSICPAP